MELSWYPTAAVMALIISVSSFWELYKIKKYLHLDDLTPTRKWKKAIGGKRHVPNHKPDKLTGDETEYDRQFLSDFSKASDLLNTWYQNTPWSFENNGWLDSGPASQSGTEREVEISYNQQKTGVIKFSCINCQDVYRFDTQNANLGGRIKAHLELINARLFEGYEVFHLATSLSSIIDGESESSQKTKSDMMMAMIHTIWQIGEGVFGNPPTEFSVTGNAQWYLKKYLPNHS